MHEYSVLLIQYPDCDNCKFEGKKVMVFLGISELEAMRWKEIDPHFRDEDSERLPTSAPPPAARFPANDQGWRDALGYAKQKLQST